MTIGAIGSIGRVGGVGKRGSIVSVIYSYAKVNAVGDSITEGADGVTPFVSYIATAWGATLTNEGVGGTILQNGNLYSGAPQAGNLLDNLDDRTARGTEALICAYGFNDARYTAFNEGTGDGYGATISATLYKAGLRQCCRGWLALYGRANVWLVTPHYISDSGLTIGSSGFSGQSREGFEEYVTACREVAEEFGFKLIDTYAAGLPAATTDGIHPTDASSQAMAALAASPTKASLAGSAAATFTGGVREVTAPAGVEAYLVDLSDMTETQLSEGANTGVDEGTRSIVYREAGKRWELASVVVTAPSSELFLTDTPDASDSMTLSGASASEATFTGGDTRNHYAWVNTSWPTGARVQATITTTSPIRILIRDNQLATLGGGGNETAFDATVDGTATVDHTFAGSPKGYFGFLTLAAGDFVVSDFSVTFP